MQIGWGARRRDGTLADDHSFAKRAMYQNTVPGAGPLRGWEIESEIWLNRATISLR